MSATNVMSEKPVDEILRLERRVQALEDRLDAPEMSGHWVATDSDRPPPEGFWMLRRNDVNGMVMECLFVDLTDGVARVVGRHPSSGEASYCSWREACAFWEEIWTKPLWARWWRAAR